MSFFLCVYIYIYMCRYLKIFVGGQNIVPIYSPMSFLNMTLLPIILTVAHMMLRSASETVAMLGIEDHIYIYIVL